MPTLPGEPSGGDVPVYASLLGPLRLLAFSCLDILVVLGITLVTSCVHRMIPVVDVALIPVRAKSDVRLLLLAVSALPVPTSFLENLLSVWTELGHIIGIPDFI